MNNLYAEYAHIFKVVSDETRLKILDMLSCGEMCACDIHEEFNISQSTLSYHMKSLTESGLVLARKNGAWMIYTLNKEKTEDVMRFFAEITKFKEECVCNRCHDKSCHC